jgi:Mg2+ and Co2+ transporter CorA
MARKKPVDERVRAFVAAMLADRVENEDEHIDDIERDMEELADAVSDEFAAQLLARQSQGSPSGPLCPDCGKPGRRIGERRREITTTRGSAPLTEPKCFCSACRRHFFPSVSASGPLA